MPKATVLGSTVYFRAGFRFLFIERSVHQQIDRRGRFVGWHEPLARFEPALLQINRRACWEPRQKR